MHSIPALEGPQRIAVTGATGMIGGALVSRLRHDGHLVSRLVRSSRPAEPGDIRWDPAEGILDPAALEGIDAVVHLAGEPIATTWSDSRKRAIRQSRVDGTTLIARSIGALSRRPRVLVSGSAIGYYGDRGNESLDEHAARGSGFLSDVVADWELAAAPAADAGVRVVLVRTGIVLSTDGGALARLLPPFRMGVGGRIGSGTQWMSWIALEDQLRAIQFALATDSLNGPVNLTAPNPVTNAEFAAVLGRVLERPAIVPAPAFVLELLFGEMARATILAGQRVLPAALLAAGFEFRHPTLEEALRAILGSGS